MRPLRTSGSHHLWRSLSLALFGRNPAMILPISLRIFPPGIRFGRRRLNLRDLWLHRRTLRRLRRRLHRRLHRLRCDALGSGARWGGDGPLHFAWSHHGILIITECHSFQWLWRQIFHPNRFVSSPVLAVTSAIREARARGMRTTSVATRGTCHCSPMATAHPQLVARRRACSPCSPCALSALATGSCH